MSSKLTAISLACVFAAPLSGQDTSTIRIATIEDVADIQTDVSEPRASFSGSQRFSGAYNCLGLTVADYELAIPIDRIVSIAASGEAAEVIVDWRGQQRTLSGTLKGSLTGKSDFGEFTLGAEKVKQLAFKSPPARQDAGSRSDQNATLFLENGHQVQLAGIQRYDSYFSTAGYIMGGSTRYNHYDDIRFMRGESVATVKFADLAKLEFDGAGSVTVTLKNGKTATGKLATGDDAEVEGWTGEAEGGLAFVAPKSVRAVVFGSAAGK